MKQQLTLLIVDRSPVARQTYQQSLSQQGEIDYRIFCADSIRSALEILQNAAPDAILLDVEQFESENFDWLDPLFIERLPMIAIVPSTAIAQQVLEAGAKDYLIKNQFTPEVLQHAIQSAILRSFTTHEKRDRLSQQLHQSEERLHLALKAAQMGAWEWNLVNDELSWSPNYPEMVGLDPNNCPTTLAGWAATIHPGDRAQAHETLSHALQNQSELVNEYRIVKPTGEIRWLNCKGRIEFNDRGEPVRMVGVTQDITEIKHQEIQRTRLFNLEKTAREEAETANQNKDEFLAIVTHELRTPLNAILGWAKLLRSRNLDSDSVERALETIERNAESQSRLIEDLLDISRIIRGRLHLKIISVSLYAVISAAIEGVKLSAEAKQIQLDFNAVDLDATIAGDPKRLQQILLNLLTNAIKFTSEHGKIVVQLTSDHTDAYIKVIDSGIGIHADFLPHVFDRFQQDHSNSASEEGLGLGLAIVRQLVELHHGAIFVESAGEGQGATFTVRFPLA